MSASAQRSAAVSPTAQQRVAQAGAPAVAGIKDDMLEFVRQGASDSDSDVTHRDLSATLKMLDSGNIASFQKSVTAYCRSAGAHALQALAAAEVQRDIVTISVVTSSMYSILAAAEAVRELAAAVVAGEAQVDDALRAELRQVLNQVLTASNNVASLQGRDLEEEMGDGDDKMIDAASTAVFAQPLPIISRDGAASRFTP